MSLDTDFSAVIFSKDLPQSSFVGESPKSLSAAKFTNAPRTLFDEIGRDLNEDRDAVSSYDRTQQYGVDSEFSWKSLVRRLREENASLLSTIKSTRTELSEALHDKERLENIVDRQETMIQTLQDELDRCRPIINEDENEHGAIQTKEPDARLENLMERKARLIEQRNMDGDHSKNLSPSPLSPFPTHHPSQSAPSENGTSTDRLVVALQDAQEGYAIERRRRAELAFQKRYLLLVNKALESRESQTLEFLEDLGIAHHVHKQTLTPAAKWRACVSAVIAAHRFRRYIPE
ncbi:hypothetical protein BJV82DRAFT_272812 [Fennellomyces sp. T-0311]|nr:hypothetical protein BJV82DRAFT_272812 [Fennellomyces sp. T-0311]